MPSKNRKNARHRRREAKKKALAQAGVTSLTNGCPAPVDAVKIEDAAIDKVHVAGPLHAPGTSLSHSHRPVHTDLQSPVQNGSHEVAPKPLSDDGALEALSAGFTSSAPSAQLGEPLAEVPLDALNALSDTLGVPEAVPEPPPLDPADIISVPKVVEGDAELVGEREDTIPPEYRFTENGTDLHPPAEEKPPMDSGAALDILSGDFTSAAPAPCAVPKQPCLEALDMLDGELAAPAQPPQEEKVLEEREEHIRPAHQPPEKNPLTSPEETVGVGPAATLPSEIPAAMVEDAPIISDLSGNMVSAQS